jgi:hypothetical protein
MRSPLPLRVGTAPPTVAARAARLTTSSVPPPSKRDLASTTVTDFNIGLNDMELIYMSPNPYGHAFESDIDLRKCDLDKHPAAGLRFITDNGRLVLASIDRGTPAARIDKWRTTFRGAWLISIDGAPVESLSAVHAGMVQARVAHLVTLLTFP